MSRETIVDRELDEELIRVTLFVQSLYEKKFNKHDQIRIENWISKLAKITYNHEWKRRRNEYIGFLAEQVHRGYLSPPFNASPPEGHLPPLEANRSNRANLEVTNIVKNTDEIAKLLEEQLGQITYEEQEVFQLSPRETGLQELSSRQAKFNNTYEITPSKTNRYKSVRESGQLSRRDLNLQDAIRASGRQKEDDE